MPRLRPELRRHPRLLWLRDPLTRLELELDPASQAVLRALDGQRPAAELALVSGLPAETVDEVLRRLLLLHLLEGAGSETVDTLRRLHAGAHELPFSVLREGRFACQGSGACCRGYERCELDAQDLAAISKLDLATAFPELASAPWFETRATAQGRERHFLAGRDGACVFLRADQRCGLHAAFGEERKPKVCRLYPYTVLPTVVGVKVYDQGECARFATSARSGPAITAELERIRQLVGPPRKLYHPVVRADAALQFDYSIFLRLQKELVARIQRGAPTALACLLQAARLQRRLFEALACCPLGDGQPQQRVGEILREAARPEAPPRSALAAGASAWAGLCGTLAAALSHSLEDALRSGMRAQVGEMRSVLGALQTRAGSALRTPLPGGPELDALFRLSFRQTLFGDFALIQDRPRAGLLRLALGYLVSLQACADRGPPYLRHFDAGHSLALRVLRRHELDASFVAWEARVWQMFEALPDMVGGRGPADSDADC